MLPNLIALIFAVQGLFILTFLLNALVLYRRNQAPPCASYPELTLCIPARNEETNLQRLLPSVFGQDYPQIKVIVYNDASTDGSAAVLRDFARPELQTIEGDGPPEGWVGKVHACYQATRHVESPLLMFLDADVELAHPSVLRRLVDRYKNLPPNSILTALPMLRGQGQFLVSLVPNAILTALPWFFPAALRTSGMGALNGQCWIVETEVYRTLEPHKNHPDEVLEDVVIGRYFKKNGHTPELVDARKEVLVHMYDSLSDAWLGFRKNAYLLLGGNPFLFLFLFLSFAIVFTVSPFISLALLIPLYANKLVTDRFMGYPLWMTAAAPFTYLLATLIQLDSAFHHWRGKVSWKDRPVSESRMKDGNSNKSTAPSATIME